MKRLVLAAAFATGLLLSTGSPLVDACCANAACTVFCVSASGHSEPASCMDHSADPLNSLCSCFTTYAGDCHAHCSGTTGLDTYCNFVQ